MRANHFSADVQELIRLFHEHSVRFLLVGGEAVIYHGYPRLTGDVDFWWEQTLDNAARLFTALGEFWGGAVPGILSAKDLSNPGVVVQFGRPPHRIDLLSAIDGVTFAEAWPEHVEEALVPDTGAPVPLPIIGLDQLIKNKRASARHKDLDDVEHLSSR